MNPLFESESLQTVFVNGYRTVEPYCLRFRNGGWTRTQNATSGYSTPILGVFPLGCLSPDPVIDLVSEGMDRGCPVKTPDKNGFEYFFDSDGKLCAALDKGCGKEICVYWKEEKMILVSGASGIPEHASVCEYDASGRVRSILSCEVESGTELSEITLDYQPNEMRYRVMQIIQPPDLHHKFDGFLEPDGSFRYDSLKIGARLDGWMQSLLSFEGMSAPFTGVSASIDTYSLTLEDGICVKIRSRQESNLTDDVREYDLKPNVKRDAMKYVYMPTLDFYPEFRNE